MKPTRLVVVPLLLLSFVNAAEPAGGTSRAAIAPAPAVVEHASKHGFHTDKIEPLAVNLAPANGDTITALITLNDKKGQRQWLTQFEITPLDEKERSTTRNERMSVKLAGQEFTFEDTTSIALSIKTAGPFAPKSKPELKQARTLVSPTFLALGFEKASEAMLLWGASKDSAKPAKEQPKPTAEQARSFAGLLPAMMSFFQAVDKTPGLREILWSVIEKPSVISFVKQRGVSIGFNFGDVSRVDAAEWGVEGNPCYRLTVPMTLNEKPALNCWFYVTSPRPPLLTSAGIVGIIAESPEDNKKRVEIRIIAARRANPVATAAK